MWTKEQESVINNRGSNLLVAAAAGSGKTAVLIERIIQLILDKENPVDVDKLLVVTFTKAAASEMKERVALAIEKALENDADNKHLQRQMMLLNKAEISTIDSFCKKILISNFHVTDLDPNIKIADPTEISIIASEVMEEMFEELYDEKNEKFLKLVDYYSVKNNDDSLISLILTINNFVNSSPYPEKWLDSSAQYFDTRDKDLDFYIKNYFIPVAKDALITLNYHYFIVKECLEEIMPYDDLITYYKTNSDKFEYLKLVKDSLSNFLEEGKNKAEDMLEIWEDTLKIIEEYKKKKFPQFRKSKKFAEDAIISYEEIKPKLDESFKSIQSEYEKLNIKIDYIKKENNIVYPYMRALSDITILFREKFAKKKEAMAIVDFADVEHYALEILTDERDGEVFPSKIAKAYSDSYVEVFTDEYQDSNLVQEMILSMVSKSDKPNRFMVGDVKQSIYRFRQAMPEIFMDKYNSYDLYSDCPESLNKKVMLYKNFRSRAEILEGCNHIFSKIMRKETGELDYTEDERLNPSAEFKEMTKENAFVAGPIEIFLVDEKDDDNKEKDISKAVLTSELTDQEEIEDLQGFSKECISIANIIYKMVNSRESNYMIFDKEIDDYRAVEYRDIVILMRSPSKKALSIEEILTEYDIPVYTDSGDGYFSTIEVDTMINLLKVIDNPIQDIPLISVMRSPIYAFNSSELARIRVEARNVTFYEALLRVYNLGNNAGEESNISKESNIGENNASESNISGNNVSGNNIKENNTSEENISEENVSEENIKISEDMIKLKNKVRAFLDSIETMREKSLLLSVDEFIWYLLKETGYYAYVGLLEMGQQRQDNLMLLFERARQYEKSSYKGLFNFINYVERMKSKASDLGEAKSISEEENVVRVMSIHKSKGLEFPVVIVANTEKRFNTSSDEIDMSLHQIMGYGPRVNDLDRKLHFDSITKKRIDHVKRNELIAEEMRLLYVAMTRAKEKLIFTGRIKDKDKKIDKWKETPTDENLNIDSMAVLSANSYLNWIMPAIINLSEREEFVNIKGETSKYIGYKDCKWSINVDSFEKVKEEYRDIMDIKSKVSESKDGINNLELVDEENEPEDKLSNYDACSYEEIKNILDSKFDYEYRYNNSANKPSSISVSEIKKIIQDSEDDEVHKNIFEKDFSGELKTPKFMHRGKDRVEFTAAEKGTIFHLAMQLLDFSKFTADENSDELVKKINEEKKTFVDKNIMTSEEADTVNPYWIARFISSPIFKEIIRANEKNKVYKEKAIDYSIKVNEVYKDENIEDSERMMMVGIIDLFFEDENGDLILLDYKTDYANDKNYEEVAKRYKLQLELYKKAMEDISGRKVSKSYIYLFSIGRLVEYKEI